MTTKNIFKESLNHPYIQIFKNIMLIKKLVLLTSIADVGDIICLQIR